MLLCLYFQDNLKSREKLYYTIRYVHDTCEWMDGDLLAQRVESLRLPVSTTAGKTPPSRVPETADIDQPPADGRRHGRPVGPLALLHRAVKVQEEKGHDVREARAHDGRLAPFREHGADRAREILLVRLDLRECRDGADLRVEVVAEGLRERVHDVHENPPVEFALPTVLRQRFQVVVELAQPFQEGVF